MGKLPGLPIDHKSPHIPVDQSNSAAFVSNFCSTGGPMIFVLMELIVESFCHLARASVRGIIEEATRCATRVVIEDPMMNHADDPDL